MSRGELRIYIHNYSTTRCEFFFFRKHAGRHYEESGRLNHKSNYWKSRYPRPRVSLYPRPRVSSHTTIQTLRVRPHSLLNHHSPTPVHVYTIILHEIFVRFIFFLNKIYFFACYIQCSKKPTLRSVMILTRKRKQPFKIISLTRKHSCLLVAECSQWICPQWEYFT